MVDLELSTGREMTEDVDRTRTRACLRTWLKQSRESRAIHMVEPESRTFASIDIRPSASFHLCYERQLNACVNMIRKLLSYAITPSMNVQCWLCEIQSSHHCQEACCYAFGTMASPHSSTS